MMTYMTHFSDGSTQYYDMNFQLDLIITYQTVC